MPKKSPECYECGVDAELHQFNSFKFYACPKCKKELKTNGMPKANSIEDIDDEDDFMDYETMQLPKRDSTRLEEQLDLFCVACNHPDVGAPHICLRGGYC